MESLQAWVLALWAVLFVVAVLLAAVVAALMGQGRQ
jgi:archaellum component FlaG (FlaF/FlaG flagellin family)